LLLLRSSWLSVGATEEVVHGAAEALEKATLRLGGAVEKAGQDEEEKSLHPLVRVLVFN